MTAPAVKVERGQLPSPHTLHHGNQDLVEFLNLAQARLVAVAVLDALFGVGE